MACCCVVFWYERSKAHGSPRGSWLQAVFTRIAAGHIGTRARLPLGAPGCSVSPVFGMGCPLATSGAGSPVPLLLVHVGGQLVSCRSWICENVKEETSLSVYWCFPLLPKKWRRSCHGTAEMNLTGIPEDAGSTPGLAQWVGDQALPELWCRSQVQLRSHVAVALSLQQLGSLLWHGFDPWPGNSHMP